MNRRRSRSGPPRAAEWILSRLLRDDIWSTPLGDFQEYHRRLVRSTGRGRADLWYWGQILRMMPGNAAAVLEGRMIMWKNDWKMALRAIGVNKGYSLINGVGLSVGIAGCLLILLFVRHELSYDGFHANADRIFRVALNVDMGSNSFSIADGPAPTGAAMVEELPEVAAAARLFEVHQIHLGYRERTFREENFFYADPEILEIFSFPLLEGDPRTALSQPGSVVLTREAAKKYFGADDPLDRVLTGENDQIFKVTGILKEPPANSHLDFDLLASSSGYPPAESDAWIGNPAHTYILIDDPSLLGALAAKLPAFIRKYVEPTISEAMGVSFDEFLESGNRYEFFLQPLRDIHLHSHLSNELGISGSYSTVLIFTAIALVILLVAIINFTNLATARAGKRANEVGVRKVVGSRRRQLVRQFMTESFFLSGLAFIVALGLVRLALPVFNRALDRAIPLSFGSAEIFLPGVIAFIAVVGGLAGLYPSLVLASFRPVDVLKGKIGSRARGGRFRNGLVIAQFIATIILLVGTTVIFKQLQYIRNKDLGFDREQIVIVQNAVALGDRQAAFKLELLRHPDVLDATYSTGLQQMALSGQIYQSEGQDTNLNHTFLTLGVDPDFIPTYRIRIGEGRAFSREMASDDSAVLLNRAAVRVLGLENPLEGRLFHSGDRDQRLHVIGTVEDFHLQSLHQAIRPMLMRLVGEEPARYLSIRIRPGRIPGTLDFIRSRWTAANPGPPAEITFFDEQIDMIYSSEIRSGKVFSAFAGLAVFVACLGLFGLASFMAERRTKEIGVRKVLGASVGGIIILLTRDYILRLAAAILLAWPMAYFIMRRWLRNFAFRTSLGIGPFLIAGGAAMAVALLTVGFQALRAARMHPARSLRYE